MPKILVLLSLITLFVVPNTSLAAKNRVWACECEDFKATITITDKDFTLLHHTKNDARDFVWQRIKYDEQRRSDASSVRYIKKTESKDFLKISQLSENLVKGEKYFVFESAELNPISGVLYVALNTRYTNCTEKKK